MNLRAFAIIGILLIVTLGGYQIYSNTTKGAAAPKADPSYSQFLAQVDKGEIAEVEIKGDEVLVTPKASPIPNSKSLCLIRTRSCVSTF